MASYLIIGRGTGGSVVLTVHIDAINQDEQVIDEIDAVHVMRNYMLTVPGVLTTITQKTESVTTIV
jgi:hypothetical protein